MKNPIRILILLLALLSANAYTIEITRHLSGSWYNPDQSGHGLSVEILADGQAVFYWYVYNPDGTPTFLIAQGTYGGNQVLATAYHVSGMRWGVFDPAEKNMNIWGEIILTFQDCNHATLNYLAAHSDTTIPNGFGEIQLVRLANVDRLQCNENPFSGVYEGVLVRNEDGVNHRARTLVGADGGFAVHVEGQFMAFGSLGEPNVEEAWSYDTELFPLEPVAAVIQVPDLSVRVDPGSRMLLTYYTLGAYGYGAGDLLAMDQVFRRGVRFAGWGGPESIERRYWLRDMNSEDYAPTEVFHSGEFSATSEQTSCSWSGAVAIPDPWFNLVDVTFEVSNCGDADGSYAGLGYYADGHDFYSGRVLYLFARSETKPMALALVPRS